MSIASFYRKHEKAFRWLIASLVIVRVLEVLLPFTQSLDRSFLDLFARLHVHAVPTEIYVVEITDGDYRNKQLFDSKSPLNAAKVAEIIRSIQQAQPAVIGVDLDTGSKEWAKSEFQGLREAPNIVWAGVPQNLAELDTEGVGLQVDCPLGGEGSGIVSGSRILSLTQIGLVVLPEDADGKVRGHRREFPPVLLNCAGNPVPAKLEPFDIAVKNQCENSYPCKRVLDPYPSKPWTERIVEIFVAMGMPPPKKEYVNFSGERYSFPVVQASEFVDANTKIAKSSNLLRDHIVLLGGSYGAARDDYRTPLGKMPGVELFAKGIQSAVGGYVLPADWPPVYLFSILVDFMLGSLAIWIVSLPRNGVKDRSTIVVGIVAPFYLLYEFHSSNIWLGAVPVVAGVCLERMHKVWEDRNELRERIKVLEEGHKKLLALPAEVRVREREDLLVKLPDGRIAEEIREVGAVLRQAAEPQDEDNK